MNGQALVQSIREIVEAVYSRFILLDLFGKILPGALLLAVAAACVTSWSSVRAVLEHAHWWLWFFIVGFSWVATFAAQALGEHIPVGKSDLGLKIYFLSDLPSGLLRPEAYEKDRQFEERATDRQKQQAERLLVIKEACGNSAIVLCLCFVLWGFMSVPTVSALLGLRFAPAVAFWFRTFPAVFLGACAATFLLPLWHKEHVDRRRIYIASVLEQPTSWNSGKIGCHMTAKLVVVAGLLAGLVSYLLLAALAVNTAAQIATTAKVGGMEADLLSLGLKNGVLTASVRLTNTNKDQIAYVLVVGSPSAVDNTSVRFIGMGTNGAQAVGGVAYCTGPNVLPPEPRRCVGSPKIDEYLFPVEQYTEIEPDNSVVMQIGMATPGAAGKGEQVSLSIPVAFRLVKTADLSKDADASQVQKLKSLRFGSIGLPLTTVNQEVTGRIIPPSQGR